MAQWKTSAILTLASVLLSFFIVLDASDKRQLWDSSADFQQSIQGDSKRAKEFFDFIAQAALIVTAGVQGIYYYGGSPALGLNLIVANSLGYYLPGVLKMMYSDPRPYWEYDRVQGIACGTGWGNPSGHALYTGSVWFSVCISLVIWRRAAWCVVVLLWVVLVGFDRTYLGVHFYSQVLLGWLFGFLIAAIHSRLHNSHSLWFFKGRRIYVLLAFHAISALLVLLGVLLYIFREPYWDPNWTQRIQMKCDKTYSASDAEIESFIESAMIVFVPGAFLGSTIRRRLTEQCREVVWWKKIILIIASFIPLLMQGGAVLLSKSKMTHTPWGAWVFVLGVSYGAGVLFTAAVPVFAWVLFFRKSTNLHADAESLPSDTVPKHALK